MSLSRLWKSVRKVVAPAIGAVLPGPIGAIAGAVLGGTSRVPSVVTPQPTAIAPASFAPMALPGIGAGMASAGMRLLPAVGAAAGGMVARGALSARRIASSAAALCRRNPSWCATIGGIAAVEAMVRSGQLPPTKRRRARGITGTELRNFKRVAKFTAKYCAPVRRAMSAPVMRKGR